MLLRCGRDPVLYLANPNNPTGAHVGREDYQTAGGSIPRLPRSSTRLISSFSAEDYVSAMGWDLHERLIVLRTFSKAYGLATNRVGFAICRPDAADFLNRLRAPFNVGAINQIAATAALEDAEHVERYVELNRVERERVRASLESMGLRVAPSQTNFLLVDFEQPGVTVYDRLLRLGVIVRPMPDPIATWLRSR